MSLKQSHYEVLLSEYSNRESAIALLKQHRPYLEMLPSMRRPQESVITIPLPVARIRKPKISTGQGLADNPGTEAIPLSCDLAILMCDPEWKIKLGVEILVFIHRPQEDFSSLLSRWRHAQVTLDGDYEWLMPHKHKHMFSEGTSDIYPLFIVFRESLERIKRGLAGACLPYIIQTPELETSQEMTEVLSAEG
ncbi:MAG: hypothetical protein F6K10_20405 [Moorea sp. SIO2B7]|nr:hypothetical protein [Moorena sp. SIO2B7]